MYCTILRTVYSAIANVIMVFVSSPYIAKHQSPSTEQALRNLAALRNYASELQQQRKIEHKQKAKLYDCLQLDASTSTV